MLSRHVIAPGYCGTVDLHEFKAHFEAHCLALCIRWLHSRHAPAVGTPLLPAEEMYIYRWLWVYMNELEHVAFTCDAHADSSFETPTSHGEELAKYLD